MKRWLYGLSALLAASLGACGALVILELGVEDRTQSFIWRWMADVAFFLLSIFLLKLALTVGEYKEEREQFKAIVKERGQELRKLSLAELETAGNRPAEHVSVAVRTARIKIIVERPLYPRQEARLVVVKGYLKSRSMRGYSVSLDGFYKYPDGNIVSMTREELLDYD